MNYENNLATMQPIDGTAGKRKKNRKRNGNIKSGYRSSYYDIGSKYGWNNNSIGNYEGNKYYNKIYTHSLRIRSFSTGDSSHRENAINSLVPLKQNYQHCHHQSRNVTHRNNNNSNRKDETFNDIRNCRLTTYEQFESVLHQTSNGWNEENSLQLTAYDSVNIDSSTIPLDILNDLCSRFVLNLHESEKFNFFRVCFQTELAHWFYLDYYRDEDKTLPKVSLMDFFVHVFRHIPFLKPFSNSVRDICKKWRNYKKMVPTCGAVILDKSLTNVLLVQSSVSSIWGFPKGKINENEHPIHCAVREVLEETGFDILEFMFPSEFIEKVISEQFIRLYYVVVDDEQQRREFSPKTKGEIKSIKWFNVNSLPITNKNLTFNLLNNNNNNNNNNNSVIGGDAVNTKKARQMFYVVAPFIRDVLKWIHRATSTDLLERVQRLKRTDPLLSVNQYNFPTFNFDDANRNDSTADRCDNVAEPEYLDSDDGSAVADAISVTEEFTTVTNSSFESNYTNFIATDNDETFRSYAGNGFSTSSPKSHIAPSNTVKSDRINDPVNSLKSCTARAQRIIKILLNSSDSVKTAKEYLENLRVSDAIVNVESNVVVPELSDEPGTVHHFQYLTLLRRQLNIINEMPQLLIPSWSYSVLTDRFKNFTTNIQ